MIEEHTPRPAGTPLQEGNAHIQIPPLKGVPARAGDVLRKKENVR